MESFEAGKRVLSPSPAPTIFDFDRWQSNSLQCKARLNMAEGGGDKKTPSDVDCSIYWNFLDVDARKKHHVILAVRRKTNAECSVFSISLAVSRVTPHWLPVFFFGNAHTLHLLFISLSFEYSHLTWQLTFMFENQHFAFVPLFLDVSVYFLL